MTKPRVKICCISSMDEARIAIEHGASALGLVGHMPSGPGVIDDARISQISKSIPPPISTFLLTSETDPYEIIKHYKRVYTTTIQIVDELENRAYGILRNELPHVKLVQVIHVILAIDAPMLRARRPMLATCAWVFQYLPMDASGRRSGNAVCGVGPPGSARR